MYTKNSHRFKSNKHEQEIAECFEENYLNNFNIELSEREREIYSTFAQWLGSSVGVGVLKSDNSFKKAKQMQETSLLSSSYNNLYNRVFSKYKNEDFIQTYGTKEELKQEDISVVEDFFVWLDASEEGENFKEDAKSIMLEHRLIKEKDKKKKYKR